MARIQGEIIIARPAEDVFDWARSLGSGVVLQSGPEN